MAIVVHWEGFVLILSDMDTLFKVQVAQTLQSKHVSPQNIPVAVLEGEQELWKLVIRGNDGLREVGRVNGKWFLVSLLRTHLH